MQGRQGAGASSGAGSQRRDDTAHLPRSGHQSGTAPPARRIHGTADLLRDDVSVVIMTLAGKWTLPVLRALAAGPLRHNELARALEPAARVRALDATLRRLQAADLVAREVHPGSPPGVSYRLTALCRSLLPYLAALSKWAASNPRWIRRQSAAPASTAPGG